MLCGDWWRCNDTWSVWQNRVSRHPGKSLPHTVHFTCDYVYWRQHLSTWIFIRLSHKTMREDVLSRVVDLRGPIKQTSPKMSKIKNIMSPRNPKTSFFFCDDLTSLSLNWSVTRGQSAGEESVSKLSLQPLCLDSALTTCQKGQGKINGTCLLGLRTLVGYKEAGTILNRNQWWWSTFISLLQFPLGVMGPKCAAFTFVKNLESLALFCKCARNVQELVSI